MAFSPPQYFSGDSPIRCNICIFVTNYLFVSEYVRFIKGPKGNEQLMIRNYLFVKHYRNGPKAYWQCSKYYSGKCKRRCITTDNGKLIISQNFDHSHPPPKNLNRVVLYERTFNRSENLI